MNFAKLAVAAIALTATPALAQEADASPVVVGAVVNGPQGNPVGTIEQVADGQVILDTGKHKVPLAVSQIGEDANGPAIGVTREQLNTMIDQQIAGMIEARDAALVPGAMVMTADNQHLGTIDTIEGDQIVVLRDEASDDKVTLLREYFDAADTGVTARLTMAQIEEALAATNGATAGATAEMTSAE